MINLFGNLGIRAPDICHHSSLHESHQIEALLPTSFTSSRNGTTGAALAGVSPIECDVSPTARELVMEEMRRFTAL